MSKKLADIVSTAPGSYISGAFQAIISNAKARQSKAGKQFYSCTLTEGGVEIAATSFGQDLTRFDGQLVTFSGMGLKRGDDYNGKAQVSIGDKAIITPSGLAPAPTPSSAAETPPMTSNGPRRIDGQTVGMSLKAALDVCLRVDGDVNEEKLHHWASMFIRLSDRLGKGDLAQETPADNPY